MLREARILRALSGSNVPHPALIAECADESVLGVAFYLMEPVDGFNATTGLPAFHAASASVRHRMGLAMAESIAALSSLDYLALGLAGFGDPDRFLARQVPRWQSQLAGYGELPGWPGPSGLPGVDRIARWLEANQPESFTPGIMHGDFHMSNVMFSRDSGDVAAIVDWELSTIGDPLLDLGWLVATWPENNIPSIADIAATPWDGFATSHEVVAHYADRSPRDLGAFDWFVVLACYKLGVVLEGTYARACAGKAPRQMGDLLHLKAVGQFERALRRIG